MSEIISACFSVVDTVARSVGIKEKAKTVKSTITDKANFHIGDMAGTGRSFVRLAGLSGALAVSMAAYGAHAFKVKTEEEEKLKLVFDTGNRIHLVHSAVLLATPFCKKPVLTGSIMSIGILLFCGSCYAHAITGNRQIRYITPYGGMALIIAWLTMIF